MMTDNMQAVHCPECGRMLFKVAGLAYIETKCPKCKALVTWPALKAVTVVAFAPDGEATRTPVPNR